jgi:hypothetical protein
MCDGIIDIAPVNVEADYSWVLARSARSARSDRGCAQEWGREREDPSQEMLTSRATSFTPAVVDTRFAARSVEYFIAAPWFVYGAP